jgi:hypothetical protein
MAATGELVSWIKHAKRGWARENDIVPIIRETVNILCKVETAQFLIIDATTGRPPLLTTADGNYGPYNGPAGSWRVSGILLKEPATEYGMHADSVYAEEPPVNTTEHIVVNGNWYYPYLFARTEDALYGAEPRIYFSRNPGTTTTRFYQRAYRAPTQITSDRIQLPIPDSYGCHRLYVLPACLALIEAIDHGNYADSLAYIENTIKPQMWKVLNGGEHGRRGRVTMRPY